MVTEHNKINKIRICLLGASFETDNLGVNALAESVIKCILHRWPDAEITQLDSGREMGEHRLRIGDKDLMIKKMPIRFCRNIFLGNHFVVLCFYGILFKLFRSEKFRRFCARRNSTLNCMNHMDLVADITGGDSFSDIYGMRRFILGFFRKWLVLLFNKKLIMLPQTYGPFKRPLAKAMAAYILKRTDLIYSRDREGIEYLHNLLGNAGNGQISFSPDVAFVLDSRRPDNKEIDSLEKIKISNGILVGLNISGLLFNGGYDRNNMFSLKVDYRAVVYDIIDLFMKNEKVSVLLVPHIFSPHGTVESDIEVCLAIYETIKNKYANRLFLVCDKYDQNEIKYVIGMCDFVIGSRMHACIAALSQGIPAVGLAYSKKFYGVFESVGVKDMVIDMRQHSENEILEAVRNVFEKRKNVSEHLHRTIPDVQARILNMFDDVEL
ncbi:MAG: polysaccharide pyruvyl transferase family protein [Sedimentisphaerales bacterium]